MGNSPTKYTEQAILNYAVDDSVSPPLLQFGLRQWDGSGWARGGDPTAHYKPAHMDASSPAYYGFIDADGNWYILKESVSGAVTTYEYAKGSSGYPTNWNNRGSLSYDSFDSVF